MVRETGIETPKILVVVSRPKLIVLQGAFENDISDNVIITGLC